MQNNGVVQLSQLHKFKQGGAAMGKKKKSVLYIGKKIYGKIPIEVAFKKALEPYFNKDNEGVPKGKIGS